MADLQSLLEKAKGTSGPDRELDALLWCWDRGVEFIKISDGSVAYGDLCLPHEHGFGWPNKVTRGALVFRHAEPQYRANQTQCFTNWTPYTASLDAVLALAARHGFYINSEPRFHIDGERVTFTSYALRPRWNDWRPDDEWFDRGEAKHADQTLSALAALIQALIAKGER